MGFSLIWQYHEACEPLLAERVAADVTMFIISWNLQEQWFPRTFCPSAKPLTLKKVKSKLQYHKLNISLLAEINFREPY